MVLQLLTLSRNSQDPLAFVVTSFGKLRGGSGPLPHPDPANSIFGSIKFKQLPVAPTREQEVLDKEQK